MVDMEVGTGVGTGVGTEVGTAACPPTAASGMVLRCTEAACTAVATDPDTVDTVADTVVVCMVVGTVVGTVVACMVDTVAYTGRHVWRRHVRTDRSDVLRSERTGESSHVRVVENYARVIRRRPFLR